MTTPAQKPREFWIELADENGKSDDFINECPPQILTDTVLQLEKDGYMSEESEREWIEDNMEQEAAEIGYEIVEVKS